MIQIVKDFLRLEASGGLVLMATAAFALLWANSRWAPLYDGLLDIEIFSTTLLHWINDGLMTVFFLMVSLEIKREMVRGALSTAASATLPAVCAVGGVVAPAVIYLWFNGYTATAHGWAIPSATDIAFSLGILSLFGRRVPSSLKVFLMALAVIDDLIAVLIIAFFYTSSLAIGGLGTTLACMIVLWVFNVIGVTRMWPYMLVGVILWGAVHYSGVHATMAGVLLGAMIPMRRDDEKAPMGDKLIHAIHPWVAFGIMPLFGFANAGVSLSGLTGEQLFHPVSLGIILGLFLGKQIGIAGIAWLLVHFRLTKLPEGANWMQFYATSALAGIGFTMSLFIGGLAFGTHGEIPHITKLGILLGSGLSAVIGCLLMGLAIKRR